MKIVLLVLISLLTTACSNKLKEKIGLETKGPNEYEVERGKPLEVPPHYYLPSPDSPSQITSQATKARLVKDQSSRLVNDGEQALMQEINSR